MAKQDRPQGFGKPPEKFNINPKPSEQREISKPISVTWFFSEHGSAAGFPPQLRSIKNNQKPDTLYVLVPEVLWWSDQYVQAMRSLTTAQITVDQFLAAFSPSPNMIEYTKELLNFVYSSGWTVTCVDVKARQNEQSQSMIKLTSLEALETLLCSLEYSDEVERLIERWSKYGNKIVSREQTIRRNLEILKTQVATALENNSGKKKAEIYCIYGRSHSVLANEDESENLVSINHQEYEPYVYNIIRDLADNSYTLSQYQKARIWLDTWLMYVPLLQRQMEIEFGPKESWSNLLDNLNEEALVRNVEATHRVIKLLKLQPNQTNNFRDAIPLILNMVRITRQQSVG